MAVQSSTIRPKKKKEKKKILVSGNAGDEKNLPPGVRKFIFFNRFSGNILFSSLLSFAFFFALFFYVFCLFVCFSKLKKYILIHTRLCGRVSEKKVFTRSDSRNKTTFCRPNLNKFNCIKILTNND